MCPGRDFETDAATDPLRGHSSSYSSTRADRADSCVSLQLEDDEAVRLSATRKLNKHIMSRFCLLTVLNNIDRANLAYASTQLNEDLGFSDSVYGFGSGVFFLGYMAFQIPSQLVAEKVGLARWLALLLMCWGAVATSFAGLTRNPTHLYVLRFLLGAFEAGTFPAMWAHLTYFYAGGPALAAAWGFIGAAQPLAQVLGGPIAAGLLLTDGFLGLRGWQWLFLMEGLPTVAVGIWIWLTLAPSPADAHFLAPSERAWVAKQVQDNKDEMTKDSGKQSWLYGVCCWKVYAQGIGSGWAGILRYGSLFWTPLIVYSIVNGKDSPDAPHTAAKSALAALLAGIPYTWAAAATLANSWHAKKSGKMYWYCIGPLSCGSAALLVLAFSLGHLPWLAFLGLILSASSQASNPLEWSYPATYLHGPALSSGWAVANCISGFGGIVGPWMIGVVKSAYGSYMEAMLILALVNSLAVVYFAVLLLYLPVKRAIPLVPDEEAAEVDDDSRALVPRKRGSECPR